MKMIRRVFAVLSAVFCLVSCNNESKRMPIYVEPWYNSEPLTIQVGKFSDVLKSEDVKKLQSTADVIRAEIDNTPIETLYVLAIRFYDLGQKDDAVYWFYTAQFRRNLYARMIENVGGVGEPAFECRQAQLVFNKLSGKWINGYAGGVPDKWLEILAQVINEGRKSGYVGLAYPKLTFKPETEQAAVAEEIAKELSTGISYSFDEKNIIVFSQSYDLENNKLVDIDYTWYRDLHCWKASLTYRSKRSELKFKINMKDW